MLKPLFATLFALTTVTAQANLIINGTRVIYPSDQKTITVKVQNPDDRPALVQSWIEHAPNANDADKKIPFVITPPIARVEPKSEQSLRVRYTGEPLATDRETLYYINLLDIPAKPKANETTGHYLQFTFRNYLKFFFRPANLPYSPEEAYAKVTWTLNDKELTFNNPTPYYITYSGVEFLQNEQGQPLYYADNIDMIAPFSKEVITLEQTVPSATHLRWYAINDYGGNSKGITKLQ